MKKIPYIFLSLLLMAGLLFGIVGCSEDTDTVEETEDTTVKEVDTSSPLPASQRLRVATTTSLYDTGLWGYLEPMFEEENGVEVDVMYAGTGKAIEYGQRGDVDVITVHSKSRENAFVADGYGIERIPFAYNYFLIVGPESDPAGIKGMLPEEALEKLMTTGDGSFVSRGDDSGTHGKEKAIWAEAGYEYSEVQGAGDWYIEAGIGMGPTLTMASEKQAYTLTDMGTYLSYKGKVDLIPIVDKGSILLNVYSVLVVNPDNVGVKNVEMAQKLADFLTSPKIQDIIDNYGFNEYGMHLFNACAGAEPSE
ncbi:MAG: substrate-binding domain-containing protein [Dehalococcoidales bacterium]|nr:substrate-binding domain-containing protein [Dehalococcoidales bacterium]